MTAVLLHSSISISCCFCELCLRLDSGLRARNVEGGVLARKGMRVGSSAGNRQLVGPAAAAPFTLSAIGAFACRVPSHLVSRLFSCGLAVSVCVLCV
jgi:hypothetical protein